MTVSYALEPKPDTVVMAYQLKRIEQHDGPRLWVAFITGNLYAIWNNAGLTIVSPNRDLVFAALRGEWRTGDTMRYYPPLPSARISM